MRVTKEIFIILLMTIITGIFSGCQHIIQLPQPVQVEQGTSKAEMLNTLNEITDKASEDDSLNILFVSGPEAEAAKNTIEEFTAKYNIKVNIFETDIKHAKELITSSGTGKGEGLLDIAVFPPYYIGAIDNYIIPLDNFIEKDNYVFDDYLNGIINISGEWQDLIMGVPVRTSIFGIVYRKDLFAEQSLPVEEDWTYDEYQDYLEKLNSGGIYGVAFNPEKSNLSYLWSNRFWTLGGKTTTEDWDITVNNDIGQKSLELYKDIKDFSHPDLFDTPYSEILTEFISGRYAILEGSPGFLLNENLVNSPVFNEISLLPTPTGPAGNCVQLESLITGILINSKHKEVSWEWIKYFTSAEMQIKMLDEYGVISPRKSTYMDEELNRKYIFLDDIYKLFEVSEVKSRWRTRASYEAWELDLAGILSEVINEDIDIPEALGALQQEWEKVLIFKPADIGIKNLE